jgi:KUP system potassium uptake protein
LKIKYPSIERGQVYLPVINWFLLAGCISVILIFKESSNMEAAYGLAIMINMLMTTCLLIFYLSIKTRYLLNAIAFGVFFLTVEGAFFISNLDKLNHGGAFSLSIASVIVLLMIIVQRVRTIKLKHKNFVNLKNYLSVISDLQSDESVPLVAENLVFLAKTNNIRHIDANIIYSIFKKQPKRARVYWFLHVEILDEPFIKQYSVDSLIPGKCFFVQLKFGFKVEHRVNVMFNKVLEDLQKSGEIDSLSHYESLRKHKIPANFKFIIFSPVISADVVLKPMEQLMFDLYGWIKKISLSKTEDFGLELSNVEVELIPIKVASKASIEITRIKGNPGK